MTSSSSSSSSSSATRAWGAWQVRPASFTQLVVESMRKLYPEELADRSWDNVGLLLGNEDVEAKPSSSSSSPKVMVTNDLTFQVAVDAIRQGVSVIVSYHPFIFSGLKSITCKDAQQATLIRLARAGIAVYCPHTAVDAAPSGLNDWLAKIIAGPHDDDRSIAVPAASQSQTEVGYGAVGRFHAPVPLPEILLRLAARLGGLQHLMIASPVGAKVADISVRSFAVCAGSGYDVLEAVDVDLLVMGETSHHSALRAIQQGRTLVQVFHSNSERAYLREVLRPRLRELLTNKVPEAEVVMSEYDKDPFTVVDVRDLKTDEA
ncbi:hypothetical protein L249_7567 [Ophiocordyceps polyrhachis-furcata BCC 54312]|uniref:YbgI/family dinuclear metal center protein n=1 Tax=Ophiocordyceps polyrhachis-furcata BCC 54312 TaxID=1330021 RepID=A0A367LBE6_9HYPO|nr:hypothetical protein L249_7567 [Ophiocordyceps polyrhachis-furcata BCC 54312]